MIPWFERPVIYDVRARPHLVESTSGSRDLQMVIFFLVLVIENVVIMFLIMCSGDEVRHSCNFQTLFLAIIRMFCFLQYTHLGHILFIILTFGCLYAFP